MKTEEKPKRLGNKDYSNIPEISYLCHLKTFKLPPHCGVKLIKLILCIFPIQLYPEFQVWGQKSGGSGGFRRFSEAIPVSIMVRMLN